MPPARGCPRAERAKPPSGLKPARGSTPCWANQSGLSARSAPSAAKSIPPSPTLQRRARR